ncbi:ArsR/SmtB family transcription factor [Sulfitobacter aestuarii]|uniref:ArsR/SmtB family transcription factor n=1 Tax=Sulfitobacter aestuarii TaxID=2161676 RepID=A0ABW5U5E4_9RHOB
MTETPEFRDGDIDRAARLMAMLASKARLQILCRLVEGELPVGELARDCGLSQPRMSQQLKTLKEAGLVSSRREGQTIYYAIEGREAAAVLQTLHELYCAV